MTLVTTFALGLFAPLYLGCAASDPGTLCDQATAHLQSCGVADLPAGADAACDATAETQAEAVLNMECGELAASPSGKSDGGTRGNTRHTAGDDFKCSFLQMRDHCACTWSARDYPDASLSGRVVDPDDQPLVLAPGQWLEVKTSDSYHSADHQLTGARVDASGNFKLTGLECDHIDLRVRVNDTTTRPREEFPDNVNPVAGFGRNPLITKIDTIPLLVEESEWAAQWATVISLEAAIAEAPIRVNAMPGVFRPNTPMNR